MPGQSIGTYLRTLAARWLGGGRGAGAPETPWSADDAVFRRASVVPDGGAQRSVAVTRLSTRGARIEFYAREDLPAEFTLVEPIRGLRRRARVLWQDDFVASVAFIDG